MIRKAVAADASRMAEILVYAKRVAFRPIFQEDNFSFNVLRVLDLALDFRDRPGALDGYYVYDDGIVRGLMHWNCEKEKDGIWQLQELYVDPFFQKMGYGGALMRNFLENARAAGMQSAFLWVLEENTAARRFYESFSFAPDGEREFQAGTDKYLLRYTVEL